MVRGALLLLLLAPAPARAACQVLVSDGVFDLSCLPALSADGQTVAAPIIGPDGGRGLPNLTVQFMPLSGAAEKLVVVTADQVADAGSDLGKALGKSSTLRTLNKRLSDYKALDKVLTPALSPTPPNYSAQVGDVTVKVSGAKLTFARAGKSNNDQFAPPATGKCKAVNKPYVEALWSDGSDAPTWVLVAGNYRGNDSCPEPAPLVHLVHLADPATEFERAASAANDRGMALYRAQNWAGAAAEFEAAIAASNSHVKAHYNLACVAAHLNDLSTVIVQLKWLKESNLPEAKAKLQKAKSDPDLAGMIKAPELQKILN